MEDPENWWVRHPTRHLLNIPWGISSLQNDPPGVLYRFVPNEFRDVDTGELVPDIALQALKRYLGYPDSLEIRHTPYYDLFDSLTIPRERDGFAYVKLSFAPSYEGGISAFV